MGNKKATGFLCLRLVPCFAYVGAEDNRKGIPFVKIVSLLCKLIQFLMVALFDAPAVADSLAVRGAELSERGVNHCTLTVSKAAEVCVTGRKYSDSATVLRREASNLPSNAQGNEVSVPDATLVSPDRAAAVAARVLDYYAQRYEQTFRMVAGDEKLADRLIVESFGGEMVRGVVTKLEFDLTGGFLADAKIVGRKLSNNAAAYAGEEIHAGERSFI